MDQQLEQLNNQIHYKFIREMPKPLYKAKSPMNPNNSSYNNSSFTIPSYSQFNTNTPIKKYNSFPTFLSEETNSIQGYSTPSSVPSSNSSFIPSYSTVNYTENGNDLAFSIKNDPNYMTKNDLTHMMNCRTIHSHILSCPVCSKIYKCHNYNHFYVIIIILILFILVLFRYFYK